MANSTINLSEISELIPEDTDGLRLAQFLQKKSGPVRNCRFALLNYEPEPFSFTVNVRKLNTPPESTGNAEQELHEPEEEQQQPQEGQANTQTVAENAVRGGGNNVPSARFTPRKNSVLSSGDRLRRCSLKRLHSLNVGGRRTLLKEFENTMTSSDFSPQVFSTPMHSAAMGQSTPSKENNLLPVHDGSAGSESETETTGSNICKVMSSLKRHDTELRVMLNDMDSTLKETMRQKYKNNAATGVTSTTAQDMQQITLQPPHRRTYTVQTGDLPGQVVRTPTHSPTVAAAMELTSNCAPAAAATERTPTRVLAASAAMERTPTSVTASVAAAMERTLTQSPGVDMQRSSMHSLLLSPRTPSKRSALHAGDAAVEGKQARIIRVKSCEDLLTCPKKISEFYHTFDITPNGRTRQSDHRGAEVPGTPVCTSKSQPQQLNAQNDEEIIPETQELDPATTKLVESLRKSNTSPMIVIPIHQTFNHTIPAATSAVTAINHGKTILPTEEEEENQPILFNACIKDKSENVINSNTVRASANHNNEQAAKTSKTTAHHDKSSKSTHTDHAKSSTSIHADHTKLSSSRVEVPGRSSASKATTHASSLTSKAGTPIEERIISDNELRLSDIITDDEDESMPLNLAPPADVISVKRRRMRRERKASKSYTFMHSDELHRCAATIQQKMNTKSGGPPPAHPLNLRSRNHEQSATSTTSRKLRKRIPLNKAPNTPINGEKFAGELKSQLARLNNREILDLRKRNSMGKIFTTISLKEPSTAERNEIIEKRIQLEENIQLEILKRTLEGNNEYLDSESEEETNCAEAILSGLPSAPDEFKDLSTVVTAGRRSPSPVAIPAVESQVDELEPANIAMHKEVEPSYNSLLVDELSADRISFIQPSINRRSLRSSKKSKRKKDTTSKIVKSYIEATETIKRNRRKSKSDISKRSLYNKGNSGSETSPNTSTGTMTSSNNDVVINEIVNIMPIPSPPREEREKANEIRIVSPPPPSSPSPPPSSPSPPPSSPSPPRSPSSPSSPPSFRKKRPLRIDSPTSSEESHNNVVPPPATFLDQVGTPSRNEDIAQTAVTTATHINSTDNEIFKKPAIPAPRKGRGKSKKHTSSKDDEIFKKPLLPARKTKCANKSKAEVEIVQSATPLRRSKRPHVPPDNTFLEIMYQKAARAAEKRFAIKNLRKKEQTMQENELLPIASSTANLLQSTNTSSNSNSATKTFRTQKKSSEKKLVEKQQQQERAPFSFLGDTNASSCSSVTSEAPTPIGRRKLSTIFEPEAAEHQQELENRMSSSPTPSRSLSPPPVFVSYSPTPSSASSSRLARFDDELPTTSQNIQAKLGEKNASIVDNCELPTLLKKTKAKKYKKAAAIVDDDAVAPTTSRNTKTEKKKATGKTEKTLKTPTKQKQFNVLECSRINVPQAPVDQLNNMFDQLKNANTISSRNDANAAAAACAPKATTTTTSLQTGTSSNTSSDSDKRVKRLCVRLKRCEIEKTGKFSTTNNRIKAKRDKTAAVATTKSTTAKESDITKSNKGQQQLRKENANAIDSTESNDELLTWLRGISDMRDAPSMQHVKIFEDMRMSAAGNLIFSNLEGVEYAFYDTDNKASLGYLRFRPQQLKAEKRAKKYHLHFIVLAGKFEIQTNHDKGCFGIGDLVAINIGSRYTIRNVANDIGLLMVIKK